MVQWHSLSHKGVSFPGKYKPVTSLNPILEEYLYYWYKLSPKLRKDETIKRNFIRSLSSIVKFDSNLLNSVNILKQLKKNKNPIGLRNTVSNEVRVKKDSQYYEFEINNCVPSPGIFIGRGSHPLRGNIKLRLKHEDITLNISKNEKTPPGKWHSIVHNNESNYIAYWKDNVCNKYKYIYMPDTSAEVDKYMKARILHKKLSSIRKKYKNDLISHDFKTRNLATCVYFIDNYLIRVGHDKDTDVHGDSVGCCTLLVKHLHLSKNKNLKMKFLGKDSILYEKNVKLSDVVYKNISDFMKNKKMDDCLFSVSATSVNAYLENLMPNLTAKVFRTCSATSILLNSFKNVQHKNLESLNQCFHCVSKRLNHVKKHKDTYVTETSTAKLNYIDPRVVYSSCKKYNIDVNKVYNNVMQKKHEWASYISKYFVY